MIMVHNIDPIQIGYNSIEEFANNLAMAHCIFNRLFDLDLNNLNCTK